ncbi:helix-turn-helix domain-containing protein [Amycolatopsis sp. cmx-11-32]
MILRFPDDSEGDVDSGELLRMARACRGAIRDLLEHSEQVVAALERVQVIEKNSDVRAARQRSLTDRECRVAELLIQGKTNRQIARELTISERTVKNHLHSVFVKLEVKDRTQAVITLMRRNL